jgi:hypothetical protein
MRILAGTAAPGLVGAPEYQCQDLQYRSCDGLSDSGVYWLLRVRFADAKMPMSRCVNDYHLDARGHGSLTHGSCQFGFHF